MEDRVAKMDEVMQIADQAAAVGPQLHAMLRARIIRGVFAPGERLSETEVAQQASVSRQPVREAFIRLAEEGLVEVRPQRGTFVGLIPVPVVLTARFIREAVEADLVSLLATTVSDTGIAELEEQIALQRALPPEAPATAFMALDISFHRLLARLAGREQVSDYLEGLTTQMTRVRHISAGRFDRAVLIAQHAAVVAAIRSRDPAASASLMRDHLRQILADLPHVVAAEPGCFSGAAALAGLEGV